MAETITLDFSKVDEMQEATAKAVCRIKEGLDPSELRAFRAALSADQGADFWVRMMEDQDDPIHSGPPGRGFR